MKIINVEQGSKAWLDWRKTVITATDASAIMGNNPWVTPYKCWQKKLGLVEEQASNSAMEKGKRLEPIARNLFNKDTGYNMVPIVVESTEYNFLGASLDGYCGKVLEVKCGGLELHDMAMHGIIPSYYEDQIQHQLLVTGADSAYYYSYFEGNGISIEVLPEKKWQEKFLVKAREFWRCVANFEAPPLSPKDYVNRESQLDWPEKVRKYRERNTVLKTLEEEVKGLRQDLIDSCEGQSSEGCGIKVIKILNKGRVDYEKIPDLKDIDLSKYRKEPTTTWTIRQG